MKALRDQWARLKEKHAALSRREKGLLAAVAVLAPLLIAETLIAAPQRQRIAALERKVAQQSVTASELQAQVQSFQHQLQLDPDAGAKAEIAALRAEQDGLESELQKLGTTLVQPEEMNRLLEQLLARHAGLRLLSLKTLKPQSVLGDPEPVGTSATNQAATPDNVRHFDLYRHGLEIRLEGSFAELHAYLVQLEQSPQRLLWGRLQYEVIDYPRAEVSLLINTLSADKSWLSL
jgi:MSHA biogenesis protein MshJ